MWEWRWCNYEYTIMYNILYEFFWLCARSSCLMKVRPTERKTLHHMQYAFANRNTKHSVVTTTRDVQRSVQQIHVVGWCKRNIFSKFLLQNIFSNALIIFRTNLFAFCYGFVYICLRGSPESLTFFRLSLFSLFLSI